MNKAKTIQKDIQRVLRVLKAADTSHSNVHPSLRYPVITTVNCFIDEAITKKGRFKKNVILKTQYVFDLVNP
jgi:hypothetical protein